MPEQADLPDLAPLYAVALPVDAPGAWIRQAIEDLTDTPQQADSDAVPGHRPPTRGTPPLAGPLRPEI